MISRTDLCRTICRKAGITREPSEMLSKDELLKINAHLDVRSQRISELERRNRDLEGLLHKTAR